jgi:hypothetical protein
MTLAPGFSNEASIIRNAEVADPGIVRHANEAQTRDRGTNGPALTGKMMHRAVAPGPGYSAAIAMPGSRQGCRPVATASTSRAIVSPLPRVPSLEAFGRRPRCKPKRRDGPSSETLHNNGLMHCSK